MDRRSSRRARGRASDRPAANDGKHSPIGRSTASRARHRYPARRTGSGIGGGGSTSGRRRPQVLQARAVLRWTGPARRAAPQDPACLRSWQPAQQHSPRRAVRLGTPTQQVVPGDDVGSTPGPQPARHAGRVVTGSQLMGQSTCRGHDGHARRQSFALPRWIRVLVPFRGGDVSRVRIVRKQRQGRRQWAVFIHALERVSAA